MLHLNEYHNILSATDWGFPLYSLGRRNMG